MVVEGAGAGDSWKDTYSELQQSACSPRDSEHRGSQVKMRCYVSPGPSRSTQPGISGSPHSRCLALSWKQQILWGGCWSYWAVVTAQGGMLIEYIADVRATSSELHSMCLRVV